MMTHEQKNTGYCNGCCKKWKKNRIQNLCIYAYSSNMLIATFNKAQVHELISCTHAHHDPISIFFSSPTRDDSHRKSSVFLCNGCCSRKYTYTCQEFKDTNTQIEQNTYGHILSLSMTHIYVLSSYHTHTYIRHDSHRKRCRVVRLVQ